jgi:CysZ protein
MANPANDGAIMRLFSGVGFALSSIAFLLADARLRKLAVIPIFLQVVCASIGAWLAWRFAIPYALPVDLSFAADGVLHAVEVGLEWLLGFFVGALALLAGVIAGSMIGSALAGFAYELMSERTEEIVVGKSLAQPFSVGTAVRAIVVEVVFTTLHVAIYLAGLALLLTVQWIPIVGQLLALAWSAFFLALETSAPSLSRHEVPARARIAHVFRHKALHLGFGSAASVMMLVPVTMPFLVVGATRLFLSLAAHGEAPTTRVARTTP